MHRRKSSYTIVHKAQIQGQRISKNSRLAQKSSKRRFCFCGTVDANSQPQYSGSAMSILYQNHTAPQEWDPSQSVSERVFFATFKNYKAAGQYALGSVYERGISGRDKDQECHIYSRSGGGALGIVNMLCWTMPSNT